MLCKSLSYPAGIGTDYLISHQKPCKKTISRAHLKAKITKCTKALWAKGVQGAYIHFCMCAHYGDKVLSCRVVYAWIEMFKNGCTSVQDAEHTFCQQKAYNRTLFFLKRTAAFSLSLLLKRSGQPLHKLRGHDPPV